MFLSWYHRLARVAALRFESKQTNRRRRPPACLHYRLITERLEDRIAPAATMSLPTSGFTGATNTTLMNFPISINALTDGAGHGGLSSASFAVT